MDNTNIQRNVSDQSDQIQKELASGYSILDVIRRIKHFQITNNQIVFYGPNSLFSQEGALIVQDGIHLGTSIDVLQNINRYNIVDIKVLTDPIDVQRYTGFNSVGVIEITMKRVEKSDNQQISKYNSTIYWNPYVFTPQTGEMSISFESQIVKTKYSVIVQGIDRTGRPIYNISHLSVY